jgi:hypothetical protein
LILAVLTVPERPETTVTTARIKARVSWLPPPLWAAPRFGDGEPYVARLLRRKKALVRAPDWWGKFKWSETLRFGA